jgi:hypothetical protein
MLDSALLNCWHKRSLGFDWALLPSMYCGRNQALLTVFVQRIRTSELTYYMKFQQNSTKYNICISLPINFFVLRYITYILPVKMTTNSFIQTDASGLAEEWRK